MPPLSPLQVRLWLRTALAPRSAQGQGVAAQGGPWLLHSWGPAEPRAVPLFSILPSTGLQPRSQEDVALGLVARIQHGPA